MKLMQNKKPEKKTNKQQQQTYLLKLKCNNIEHLSHTYVLYICYFFLFSIRIIQKLN